MNQLLDKMRKASTIKEVAPILESKIYGKSDFVRVSVPLLNVALSGRVDGGLTSGVTTIAGPSKCFKTLFSLILAKAYLDKYKDAILVFYDNEFGSPPAYLESVGIDSTRVLHVPFMNIEDLKFDLIQKLEAINRGEKIFFMIDSIGNVASKKELEDAKEQKSVADMTRAKQLKSLFRMVTPYTATKDVPLVVINHIYMTQEMYSKAVVSGGTGIMYSSNTVWIVTKSQEKDADGLAGYTFKITIEKSRFVKEKSQLPITVRFDRGVDVWSGFFDLAMEMGYIKQTKQGWYALCELNKETGELVVSPNNKRRSELDSAEVWNKMLRETDFADAIYKKYSLVNEGNILTVDSELLQSLEEASKKEEE